LIGYAEAQRAVLFGLYRLLSESDRQEWFSAADIRLAAKIDAGAAFVSRVLTSTEEGDEYVSSTSIEGETLFALERDGFEFIESAIAQDITVYSESAMDKVVDLSAETVDRLVSLLEKFLDEVRKSNELGAAFGERKIVVENEINAAKSLVEGRTFRSTALVTLAWKPLKYVAEKFSGSAVGEIAKNLINEIWKSIS
jgi:hypothetical protein